MNNINLSRNQHPSTECVCHVDVFCCLFFDRNQQGMDPWLNSKRGCLRRLELQQWSFMGRMGTSLKTSNLRENLHRTLKRSRSCSPSSRGGRDFPEDHAGFDTDGQAEAQDKTDKGEKILKIISGHPPLISMHTRWAPLPVISMVISPLIGVITPVTQL